MHAHIRNAHIFNQRCLIFGVVIMMVVMMMHGGDNDGDGGEDDVDDSGAGEFQILRCNR